MRIKSNNEGENRLTGGAAWGILFLLALALGFESETVVAQTELDSRMTPEERALAQEQMTDMAKMFGGETPLAPSTIEALKQAGLWTEADTEGVAPTAPYTAGQLAAIASIRALGTIPQFLGSEPTDELSEDDFFDDSLENRRDAEGVPNTALILRRFAGHLLEKYDVNDDGRLEESEWKTMPGTPQAIDMNGDLVLEEHEILYYLARYAKGRTVAHPIPRPTRKFARAIFQSDAPIMIRPLSAPIRITTLQDEEELQKATRVKPSDMSQDEFRNLMDETDKEAGTEENSELFGLMMKEMNASRAREYAATPADLEGVPRWFLLRDVNGDGQLSLREFAPTLSLDSTAFFGRLDADRDGLVTPEEVKDFMAHGLRPKERTVTE